MADYHRLVNVLILVGFLVGCGTDNSTFNTTSKAPQVFQSAPVTDSLENSLTITPNPFITSTPDKTPFQTQTAFNQSIFAQQTEIAHFPHGCTSGFIHPTYPGRFSPDGSWLEELCYSENDKDIVMTISNRDTQALWKLTYLDFLKYKGFTPDGGMLVVHWNGDGKYAYFMSYTTGDGGECFVREYDSGRGLFRLELQSGQVATILPPNMEDWLWYGFSFSPTDRRLVYGVRSRDLKIVDIQTGQVVSIAHKKELSQTGGYEWSADGLELVYSAATHNFQEGTTNYSLRLADVQSGSEQILLESKTSCYLVKEWKDNDHLIIEYDDENHNRALMAYDLNSNAIINAPVSPAP